VLLNSYQFFSDFDPNAYVVTVKVTAGEQNIEQISVQATSDIETTASTIGGLFVDSDQKVAFRIHAMDASSIHTSVTSYHLSE